MGKSHRSNRGPAQPSKPAARLPALPILIGGAAILAGAVWLLSGDSTPAGADSPAPTAAVQADAHTAQTPAPRPDAVPATGVAQPVPESRPVPATGELPPLPFVPGARPPEVVRAVYEFAARRPDVLQYVPCFCGCERQGHGANDDCFVATRDARGRVTWDAHGAG